MNSQKKVLVVNSEVEILDMLETILTVSGVKVVGTMLNKEFSFRDFEENVKNTCPDAILFDIPNPYEENWRKFIIARQLKGSEGRRFIVTTSSPRAVEKLCNTREKCEIIGFPFEIDQLLEVINGETISINREREI